VKLLISKKRRNQMPDEDIQGQGSDSPTDTTGQESTDTPISDTDKVLNALEKSETDIPVEGDTGKDDADKTETENGNSEDGNEDKPLPYDKDPKWKAARAAERSMLSF
jgi:hypothetical protein